MSPPAPRDRATVATHELRLATIERNASDLAKSVGALSEEVGRVASWQRDQELIRVREDERDKALYKRLDEIEDSIKEIKSVWVRIQWIIISAVMTGLIGWFLATRVLG